LCGGFDEGSPPSGSRIAEEGSAVVDGPLMGDIDEVEVASHLKKPIFQVVALAIKSSRFWGFEERSGGVIDLGRWSRL
jgi:hypothetical protein